MVQRSVVMGAAWLEIVAGAIFLMSPDVPCVLLFAAKPEGIGITLARWVGVALFALGIACLPSTAVGTRRSAVVGLFAFNAGVVILFAWVGVATMFHGVLHGFLLWPAAILHAVIAAALLRQLVTKDSSVS